jgi:hypothetical protein
MQASSVCILAGLWPVRTVICFSCTCKDAAEVCEEPVAGSTALFLLENAVANAVEKLVAAEAAHSAAAVEAAKCLQQQVAWLVKQAGLNILQGKHTAALLCLPIALELATVLVGCGARFTFAQLVAAVEEKAAAGIKCAEPGPKEWMRAYRQHGLARPSDMPAVAEAMCCGDELTEEMLVSLMCSVATFRNVLSVSGHARRTLLTGVDRC